MIAFLLSAAITFTLPWEPGCNEGCAPAQFHLRWTGPQSGETIVGNVRSYTFTGLPAGSYMATVATIDTANDESDPSEAVPFVITAAAPPVVPPATSTALYICNESLPWGEAPAGCNSPRCAVPVSQDKVSTDNRATSRVGWQSFGTLLPTDKVDVCAAVKSPATPADIVGRVSVASLGVTPPPVPVPPPIPPPTPPPVTPPAIVEVLGTFTVKKGTSNVVQGKTTVHSDPACLDALKGAAPGKYSCVISNTLTVPSP